MDRVSRHAYKGLIKVKPRGVGERKKERKKKKIARDGRRAKRQMQHCFGVYLVITHVSVYESGNGDKRTDREGFVSSRRE